MNARGNHLAMDEYRKIEAQSQVAGANPHALVQLMLDGAAGRVAAARGALEAGETAAKGELIGKAIGLIEGLRTSLDFERGGELAANLSALYQYMARRLVEANLRNDATILDEIASLLRELQIGWREMGQLIAGEDHRGSAPKAAAP